MASLFLEHSVYLVSCILHMAVVDGKASFCHTGVLEKTCISGLITVSMRATKRIGTAPKAHVCYERTLLLLLLCIKTTMLFC